MPDRCIIFRGTSMWPCLKNGDRVYTERVPMEQLRAGDLVAVDALRSDICVIHRIIGWRVAQGQRIGLLKGDNLLRPDRFVLSERNYRGRVRVRGRSGRHVDFEGGFRRALSWMAARLSIVNMTPGPLRAGFKNRLEHAAGRIPGREYAARRAVRHLQYYRFTDCRHSRRILATFHGRRVGEVAVGQEGPAAKTCSVAFPFFLVIFPEDLAAEVNRRLSGPRAG